MLDKNLISEDIKKIQDLLKIVESFKEHTLEEIVNNFHLYGSLRYAFIELIGRAIDINQHLIKEGGADVPNDYTETFKILGKMDILEQEFADEISKSVGMRNIVVHEYGEVDERLLYNSIDIALDQYPKYCQKILDFIRQ